MVENYTEYINAVMNPKVSFFDIKLQQGSPVYPLKHTIRPVMFTGHSTLVFKFKIYDMFYAIRCYLFDMPQDTILRYSKINAFIEKNSNYSGWFLWYKLIHRQYTNRQIKQNS